MSSPSFTQQMPEHAPSMSEEKFAFVDLFQNTFYSPVSFEHASSACCIFHAEFTFNWVCLFIYSHRYGDEIVFSFAFNYSKRWCSDGLAVHWTRNIDACNWGRHKFAPFQRWAKLIALKLQFAAFPLTLVGRESALNEVIAMVNSTKRKTFHFQSLIEVCCFVVE